jgi:hypothetical protein
VASVSKPVRESLTLIPLPIEIIQDSRISPTAKQLAGAILSNGVERGMSYRTLFNRGKSHPAIVTMALAELEVSKHFVTLRLQGNDGKLESRIFHRTAAAAVKGGTK